jgi:hypothetical protein
MDWEKVGIRLTAQIVTAVAAVADLPSGRGCYLLPGGGAGWLVLGVGGRVNGSGPSAGGNASWKTLAHAWRSG